MPIYPSHEDLLGINKHGGVQLGYRPGETHDSRFDECRQNSLTISIKTTAIVCTCIVAYVGRNSERITETDGERHTDRGTDRERYADGHTERKRGRHTDRISEVEIQTPSQRCQANTLIRQRL